MRQRDIIAASAVLGLCFLSAMALLARHIWIHKHKDDGKQDYVTSYTVDGEAPTSPGRLGGAAAAPKKMRTPFRRRSTNNALAWPTVATLIHAGDGGVFSSLLFQSLHAAEPSTDISLDALYDAFADALKRQPAAGRLALPRIVSQFVGRRKSVMKESRSLSTGHNATFETPVRQEPRKSLEKLERRKSWPRARRHAQAPALVTLSSLLPLRANMADFAGLSAPWDVQLAQHFQWGMAVAVSPQELASLSVLLATRVMPLPSQGSDDGQAPLTVPFGDSAFGISIETYPLSDGQLRVSLKRQKLQLSEQLPPLSSGHSILFARHMACGSLPFSQDALYTYSMLITIATAEAISAGTPVQLDRQINSTVASAKFLSSLPHSRRPALYALVPTPSTTKSETVPQLPTHLLASLSLLPFSTMPPLASIPLITTVRFIASAGLPPGRLLQRLEYLIEKIHRHTPDLALFGPLYRHANAGPLLRESDRLGKLGTPAGIPDTMAQRTARLHRYGILMERLMAMLVEAGFNEVELQRTVQNATMLELEKSYVDALSASRSHTPRVCGSPNAHPSTTAAQIAVSLTAMPRTVHDSTASSGSRRSASTRRSGHFGPPNLGSQLEDILKAPLPLSLEQVVFIARLVLVAWSLTARAVAWEDAEEGICFDFMGEANMAMG